MTQCTVELSMYLLSPNQVYAHLHYSNVPLLSRADKLEQPRIIIPMGKPCLISCKDYELSGTKLGDEWATVCKTESASPKTITLLDLRLEDSPRVIDIEIWVAYFSLDTFLRAKRHLLITDFNCVFPYPEPFNLSIAQLHGATIPVSKAFFYLSTSVLLLLCLHDHDAQPAPIDQAKTTLLGLSSICQAPVPLVDARPEDCAASLGTLKTILTHESAVDNRSPCLEVSPEQLFLFYFASKPIDQPGQECIDGVLQQYRPDRFFVSLAPDLEVYKDSSNNCWIYCNSIQSASASILLHFFNDAHLFMQPFLDFLDYKPTVYLYPVDSALDCDVTADLVQYCSRAGPFSNYILIPFVYSSSFITSAEACINVAASLFAFYFTQWVISCILSYSTAQTLFISSLVDFVVISLFYQHRMLILLLLEDSGLCMDDNHVYDPYALENIAMDTLLHDIRTLKQTVFYDYDKRLDIQIYDYLILLHRSASFSSLPTYKLSKYISNTAKLLAFSSTFEFASDLLTTNWTQDPKIKEIECSFFAPLLTRYIRLNSGAYFPRERDTEETGCASYSGFMPEAVFVCSSDNKLYLEYFAKHAAPFFSYFAHQSKIAPSQPPIISILKDLLLFSSNISISPTHPLDMTRELVVSSRKILTEMATLLSPPICYNVLPIRENVVRLAKFSKHHILSPSAISSQFFRLLYKIPHITVQSELYSLTRHIHVINTLHTSMICYFQMYCIDTPILLRLQPVIPGANKKAFKKSPGSKIADLPAGISCIVASAHEYSHSLTATVQLTEIISSAHNQARLLEQLYIKSHHEDKRNLSIYTHFDSNLSVPCYSLRTLVCKELQNENPLVVLRNDLHNFLKKIYNLSADHLSLDYEADLSNLRFVHILHTDSFKKLIKIVCAKDSFMLQVGSGSMISYPSTNTFFPIYAESSVLGIVEPFLLFVCPRNNPPSSARLVEALNISAKNAHIHFLQRVIEISRVSTATVDFVDIVMSSVETQGIFSRLTNYFLVIAKLLFVLRSIALNESPAVLPQLRRAAASYLYLLGDRVWLVDYLTNLLQIIRRHADVASAGIALNIIASLLPIFCRIDVGLYLLLKLCTQGVNERNYKIIDADNDEDDYAGQGDLESNHRLLHNISFYARVLRNAAIFKYTRTITSTTTPFDLQRACSPTCMCDLDNSKISSTCQSRPKAMCSLKTMLGIKKEIRTLLSLLTTPDSERMIQLVTSLDDVSELVQSTLFYAVTQVRLFSDVTWLSELPSICNNVYICIERCISGSSSPCTLLNIMTYPDHIRAKVHIIHLQIIASLIGVLIQNYELVIVAPEERSSSPYWMAMYEAFSHIISINIPMEQFDVSSVMNLLIKFAASPEAHVSHKCRSLAFDLIYVLLSHTNIMSQTAPAHSLYIDIITGSFGTERSTGSPTFLEWVLEIQPYIVYFMSNFGGYAFNPQRPSIPRIFTFLEPSCPACFFGSCTCSSLSGPLYYSSLYEMSKESFLKKMLAVGQTILALMNPPLMVCGDMRIYASYERAFVARIEDLRAPRIKKEMDFIAKLMLMPSNTDNHQTQILVLSEISKEEAKLIQSYCVHSHNVELRAKARNVLAIMNLMLGDSITKHDILTSGHLIVRDAPHEYKVLGKAEPIVVHFKNKCLCIRSCTNN